MLSDKSYISYISGTQVIQVVYLTFGHDGVKPTVHSAKIRVWLWLSSQMCIKYAQTMAATKQNQVYEECQTVVLLMGKMHWGLWHLCNW